MGGCWLVVGRRSFVDGMASRWSLRVWSMVWLVVGWFLRSIVGRVYGWLVVDG